MNNNFIDLSSLLSPDSIAIVGASENPVKMGGRVIINLQKSQYQGKLFLVNPNYTQISGLKSYDALTDIEEEIDVVIVTVPLVHIFSTLDECKRKKVKYVMILSAGFAEMGQAGRKIQSEIEQFAKQTGIRIYGPNVPGLFNIKERIGMSLSPRFEPNQFVTGKAALITQGGGMGRAILDSNDSGIGYCYWASTGNEADLEISDFIYHFSRDPDVEIIMILIEGIRDGRKFIRACQEARRNHKPVIALKIGRSKAGKDAVMSHTGALAGDENVTDAIFKQSGIIQVRDIDELVNTAWILSTFGIRSIKNVGVMSFSGGANGILADKCGSFGLHMGELSQNTVKSLEEIMPSFVHCKNPMDLTTFVLQEPDVFSKTLDIVTMDENVDMWFVPIPYMLGLHTERMAKLLVKKAKSSFKPIIPLWTSRATVPERSYEILVENRMPFFRTFNEAAKVLSIYSTYCNSLLNSKVQKEIIEIEVHEPVVPPLPNNRVLTESESKVVFSNFNIPVIKEVHTYSPELAVNAARKIGYPVNIKIESPDISQEIKMIMIKNDIKTDVEVREAYTALLEKAQSRYPKAKNISIIVQEIAEIGIEIIVGLKHDSVFGLIATLGLGGIFEGMSKVVSMRALPLSYKDINEMIHEIHSTTLFKGYRGENPRDISALKELLMNLSTLGMAYVNEIEVIDMNPIMLFEEGKGLKVLDALFVKKMRTPQK